MAHGDHSSWPWLIAMAHGSWLMAMTRGHGDHGSSVFVLVHLFFLILSLLLLAIVITRTRSALWLGICFSSALSARHSVSFLLGSLGSALALLLGFSAPHSLSFPRYLVSALALFSSISRPSTRSLLLDILVPCSLFCSALSARHSLPRHLSASAFSALASLCLGILCLGILCLGISLPRHSRPRHLSTSAFLF